MTVRSDSHGKPCELNGEPLTWIFGYGSLVFRPGFPFVRREIAIIEGWSRRFWQGSTDHRGVPGAPGRVVTLVAERDARTTGAAYAVETAAAPAIMAALDHREQGGYDRLALPLYDARGGMLAVQAEIYVATPENPNWLGDAPIDVMVAQIQSAVGPSGRNVDYVLTLAQALRELGSHDAHVEALAALLA